MSAARVRSVRAIVAVISLVMLAGCSQPQRVALCDGQVEHVEVFNGYADHAHADRHVVEDADEIAFACSDLWTYEGLRRQDFTEDQLNRRAVTVLVLQHEDGTSRSVWAHRLAGVHAGTAILIDDGGSFLLPNQGLPHYYGPDAEVVGRDRVPSRPAAP